MIILKFQTIVLVFILVLVELHAKANALNLKRNNITYDETPSETQSAQCTITAGEIQASAEATISKTLDGVCATSHLSRAFSNLEQRLLHEINQLKTLINILVPALYQNHYYAQPYPVLYQPILSETQPITSESTTIIPTTESNLNTTSSTPIQTTTEEIQNESPNIDITTFSALGNSTEKTIDFEENKSIDQTDSKPSPTEKILQFRPVQDQKNVKSKFPTKQKTGPRDFEIRRFNNTILSGDDIRIFTYYWRIEKFSEKLHSNVSIINSPIVSISGLHLRVKATLNHLGRDYLHLQVESIPIEKIQKQTNIILAAGEIFKEINTKMLFKHKITVLDQMTPTSDLISHEFLDTSSGFTVPNSAIKSGSFTRDDNILIKIVIFL